jgi:hypothetical protein
MFDNIDTYFITMILTKYKKYIENCMKKTMQYKLIIKPNEDKKIIVTAIKKGKESTPPFFPIGFYYNKEKEFRYYKNINEILLDHIKKYNFMDIIGNTVNKLFKNVVKINNNEHLIIPCLLGIVNPAFNVVKFETEGNSNTIMYALIKLNIECKFNYNRFIENLKFDKMLADKMYTKKLSNITGKYIKKSSKKKSSKK